MKTPLVLLAAVILCAAVMPVSALEPNDPFYQDGMQWYLDTAPFPTETASIWGGIDAPTAWEVSTGSPDIIVAVIDTGVDIDHPDLQANIWTNTDEIAGNGIDDDGNGYIDDVHGWNFAKDTPDITDYRGHGTACAGIIGAAGNNAAGITGVVWSVKIMPVVFGQTADDFAAAIRYAVDNGARIISYSVGSDPGTVPPEEDQAVELAALQYAGDHDVLFVNAAGNENTDGAVTPVYPAEYTKTVGNMLVVAASTAYTGLAAFSNYGTDVVDLAAPGTDIWTTVPDIASTAVTCLDTANVSDIVFIDDDSSGWEMTEGGYRIAGRTTTGIGSAVSVPADDVQTRFSLYNRHINDLKGTDTVSFILTTRPLNCYDSLRDLEAGIVSHESGVVICQISGDDATSAATDEELFDRDTGVLLALFGDRPLYPGLIYQAHDARSSFTQITMTCHGSYRIAGHTYSGAGSATPDGTSLSCPLVAGSAALLLAIDANLTVADLKRIILSTVAPVPDLNGTVRSGGQLDLGNATRLVAPPVAATPAPVLGILAGIALAVMLRRRGT